MTSDIDIYKSAKIFIDKHGDNALLNAMQKEQGYCLAGDMQAAITWRRIADAITWLQCPEVLLGDETCH
jgi:hypothetical protein